MLNRGWSAAEATSGRGQAQAKNKSRAGGRKRRLTFEPLEDRRLLDGLPVISEFLALNRDGLQDNLGHAEDWIELHNPTDAAIDLDDWYLTDDSSELDKWKLPDVMLPAGGYLVIFASNRDLDDPAGELHTNFALKGDGEFLALVQPDGVTIAHRYTPKYPGQFTDISYGVTQDSVTLLGSGATAKYYVPKVGDGGLSWTAVAYNDSGWVLPPTTPLLQAGFAANIEGFTYADGVFGTSTSESRINGAWNATAGYGGTGGLKIDATTSTSRQVSGGFYKDVSVATDGLYRVSLRYRVTTAASFTASEYTEAALTIDGVRYGSDAGTSLLRQYGNGSTAIDSGWRTAEIDVNLAAGTHRLTFGILNARGVGTSGKASAGYFDDASVALQPAATAVTGLGFSTGNGFTVNYYKVNTTAVPAGVNNTTEAESIIADPAKYSTKVTQYANTINYYGTGGNYAHYTSDLPFPTQTINVEVNDFIIEATATVFIPTAGAYTFGVNSDDGFKLSLSNGVNSYGMEYPGTRGGTDSLQTFNIAQPGAYTLRLVHFDHTGGSELELFAAPGTQASWTAAAFDLVGDTANGGLAVADFGGAIATDISSAMLNVNSSLWVRVPFTVASLEDIESLVLRMKYNDGFVAYLNGTEIARDNAPATLAYNSTSLAPRDPLAGAVFSEFNVTAFRNLLQLGNNVLAVHALNNSASDGNFFILPELVALNSKTDQRYFTTPTPGAANLGSFLEYVSDTQFSHDRGFYTTPFDLVITTDTPGASIRYTLDGSEPTSTTGLVYSAPIRISGTSTVRAIAYRPGWQPTNVDTQTYLFLQEVLTQSAVGQPPVAPSGGSFGATFTSGLDGFTYYDDRFGTSNPNAALGVYAASEGQSGGGLKVSLGPGPTTAASGAFERTITVDSAGLYGFWFRYRLTMGPDFATDEYGEVVATVDGTRYGTGTGTSLVRFTGDGVGGNNQDSGWAYYGFNLNLTAGTHTLRLGAYMSDADTSANKWLNGFFDEVIVSLWPAVAVNGQVIDYGMDPDIVNSATWGPQMMAALQAIPTISIVTSLKNLFDPATGLIVNADQVGDAWERAVSLELINPDGSQGFQANAGMRIRGGFSVSDSNPKHAFRFFFRDEYGDAKLEYPLFGDEGVDEFDKLDLRCSQNYSWSFQGSSQNSVVRDVFARDTQGDLGSAYTRSRPYHVYINGQYWGLFETQERAEANYAESYFGDDDSDYDVVKVADQAPYPAYTIFATDGNMNAWQDLWDQAAGKFTAITYLANLPVTSLSIAESVIADKKKQTSVIAGPSDTINFLGTGAEGRYSGSAAFPGIATGVNADNYVVCITGTIEVPTTGLWTFGVSADEGFRLELSNGQQTFTMSNPGPNGVPVDTLATFNFTQAGSYNVRLVFFDNTGGSGLELFAAPGQRTTFDAAAFDLVGDTANGGLARSSMTSNTAYLRAQGLNPDGTANPYFPKLLDVENLIDYMMIIFFTGNTDAPISNFLSNQSPNNWSGTYNRANPDGFKFFVHDSEHTLTAGSAGYDRTGPYPAGDIFNKSNPQWIHQQLMYNAEYRLQFADRAHKLLTNGGLLTGTPSVARYQERMNEIDKAIIAESARWGDAKVSTPFTKDTWVSATTADKNYLAARAATILSQLRVTKLRDNVTVAPLYPTNVTAPTLSAYGGNVPFNYALYLYGTGTIYYTLDGADPRLFGGAVASGARLYAPGVPITLSQSTSLKARILYNGNWSPLVDVQFYAGPAASAQTLAITEINYNPHEPTAAEIAAGWSDAKDFEFVELQNIGTARLDLTGVRFTDGITFDFSQCDVRWLDPGQTVVVAADRDAFAARYGTVAALRGEYSGSLDNAGEKLELVDRYGIVIRALSYSNSGSWPGRADGRGSTLEIIDPRGDADDAGNWQSSLLYGGTPGVAGSVPPRDIVINEVLAAPTGTQVDAIELYNTTNAAISIAGWYLTNSNDGYEGYRIETGDPRATIAPHAYVVFTAADFNSTGGAREGDFDLNPNGDEVWLIAAAADGALTRFVDHAEFGFSPAGVSYGLAPDGSANFTLLIAPTLGAANDGSRIGSIVINEIHANPDVETELVEYIELYNRGTAAVDLGGWQFTAGVAYTFAANTILQPGQYIVLAENLAAFFAKFGVAAAGQYTGSLDNEGEQLVLRDRDGFVQDEVDYQLGFPWPIVGDAPGYSIELINPWLDNNLGGSWRPSTGSPVSQAVLVDFGATWKYFKGTVEPSTAAGAWRQLGFDDTVVGWASAAAPYGYNEPLVTTTLADMQNGYSSVYLRRTFTVADPWAVRSLLLEMKYDDGVNVWINGQLVVSANVPGAELPSTATASSDIEANTYLPFTLTDPQTYLVAGTNVIAVQWLNVSAGNEDAFFDAKLRANLGGSAGSTPGRINSVAATNAPPQVRQVAHSIEQPRSGQEVIVTAKVTDPDGVQIVRLLVQLVNPGDYIAINDARFTNPAYWATIVMRDDGLAGDLFAGDDIYTAVIPPSVQTHRRLIRYKITATDGLGLAGTAPYADDPQPNFAYYVYDGVPAYTAKTTPTSTAVTYGADLMSSVPVYQLITTRQNAVNSQYVPYRPGQADQVLPTTGAYGGEDYLWSGTLVYDGQVYDHIDFRARGGVWRYAMGKNMWKFDFNRGHEFQAEDNYGDEYGTKMSKLNLGAAIQQGDYWHRGEQGLFESVGFKLFDLAGVTAPNTNYVQFRIVAGANENGADQYSGDFQGLYLVVEQPDGELLDEHDLPDGNLYKMESGTGVLNNQGPTQPSDKSDLNAFLAGYNTPPTEAWWRANVELDEYFSYRAIVDAIHHYDIGYGKNYFYYHNPETGKWSVIPWDLDLTWSNNMYGNGEEPFKAKGILNIPALAQEYRNRMREVLDLLYNTEQTGMLIDEYASFIYTPGANSLVDADRAMWDYNPIMTSSYVNSSKAGQGRFYAGGSGVTIPAPGGFAGMMQKMKNYVVDRTTWIYSTILTDEAQIPNRPTISYVGDPGYVVDGLRFQTSTFSSPSGATFAAMEWRVARVTDPNSLSFNPYDEREYEINANWESGELTTFNGVVTVSGAQLDPGETYRARVRVKDSAGRWSHWSTPLQFVAETAQGVLAQSLRLTEIMYNPPAPTAAEIAAGFVAAADFEYLELRNISTTETLDLTGVQFTQGIDFDFAQATIRSLAPGQSVLVVANAAAMALRYGAGLPIAGEFKGNLSAAGERLKLEDPWGTTVFDFSYDDSGLWPGRADGGGSSLQLVSTAGEYADPLNWRNSTEFGGSPGVEGVAPITSVVINEVLTHTDPPLSDSIELHNTTGSPVSIAGWWLSDSSDNYRKYQVAANDPRALIPAYGYVVFNEADFNPTPQNPGANDFTFDGAHGDDAWIVKSDVSGKLWFVDHVKFGPTRNGESLGRWPNETGSLAPMQTRTLGSPNSGPRVGPLVISEVCYAPLVGDDEFIELYNPTAQTVDLSHWQLVGGVDFAFAAGTLIAPGEALVLTSLDVAAFRANYGLAPTVRVLSGLSGKLDNAGERVRLMRPDDPPLGEPNYYPLLIEDEVDYLPGAPWPEIPVGQNRSLQRIDVGAWGNAPTNWDLLAPTPGAVGVPTAVADVAGTLRNTAVVIDILANDMAPSGTSLVASSVELLGLPSHGQATIDPATGRITYTPTTNFIGQEILRYRVSDNADHWSNEALVTIDVYDPAAVVGRSVYYDHSAFDNPIRGRTDADSLAPGKTALVAPGSATAAHYTSYSRGLNGVMLELSGLPFGANLSAADFVFRVGNSGDPASWTAGPAPVAVTTDAATGRVWIAFADGAIHDQWLEVTLKANPALRLFQDSVMCVGNLVGDVNGDFAVTTADVDAIAAAVRPLQAVATDSAFDLNRDGVVNASDVLLARRNIGHTLAALTLVENVAAPQSAPGEPAAIEPVALQAFALAAPPVEMAVAPAAEALAEPAPAPLVETMYFQAAATPVAVVPLNARWHVPERSEGRGEPLSAPRADVWTSPAPATSALDELLTDVGAVWQSLRAARSPSAQAVARHRLFAAWSDELRCARPLDADGQETIDLFAARRAQDGPATSRVFRRGPRHGGQVY